MIYFYNLLAMLPKHDQLSKNGLGLTLYCRSPPHSTPLLIIIKNSVLQKYKTTTKTTLVTKKEEVIICIFLWHVRRIRNFCCSICTVDLKVTQLKHGKERLKRGKDRMKKSVWGSQRIKFILNQRYIQSQNVYCGSHSFHSVQTLEAESFPIGIWEG